MANRLKSSKSQSPDPHRLKPEKVEQVSVKQLVKDERTHKIAGAVLLLLGLFLFIAFASYLFTWKEDQDKVFQGSAILLPSTDIITANLLGNFGAYIAHQFFYNAFGFASFLFCSLFLVFGINAIAGRKIFSAWRNIRYVVVGILFFSIALSFFIRGNFYPLHGGAFGEMVSNWMERFFGWIGAASILFVAGMAYVIWRFNPVFRLPRKNTATNAGSEPEVSGNTPKEVHQASRSNILKEENGVIVLMPGKQQVSELLDLNVIEKDVPAPVVVPSNESLLNGKGKEKQEPLSNEVMEITGPVKKNKLEPSTVELEINAVPDAGEEELIVEKVELAPYEPTLDLKDYKYPTLDLLETHGSEKIIQDPAELQKNKDQIERTLSNYDIAIQKITATVGPTVTLYEIVPAPGVRISRIKNLEDDIALSLAALGIRIIAPIPGKGTIGIEVPNVKKPLLA